MTNIKANVGIIAAGPSGLAAAIAAAENGASVAVFEKSNITGGSANMGMGPFAVESRIQKGMLDNLTKEDAFQQYMADEQWNVDAQIVHDYFWRSADTIDWLMGMGVHFVGAIKNFPESRATWHVVQPEDGGQIGSRCASVMYKKMTEKAKELGVKFYLNTPATSLKKDGDKVIGFYAKGESGEEYDVEAAATIVCTGGFGTNPDLVASETGYTIGKDMITFMIPGVVGDGVKMVWNAGGKKGRTMMEKIIGQTIEAVMRMELNQYLNFLQGSPIAVNKAGCRVCDESVMQNMAIGANIIDYQQDRTVYKILDDKMIRYFRKNGQEFPNEVFPGDPTENFEEVWEDCAKKYPDSAFVANTVEELAEKMGIPAAALAKTVEKYNDICTGNYDSDFGKPRQYLRALDGKKFFGYRVSIGAYGSLGGIKVNPSYEVIAEDGSVIKGLYSAGNDSCELYNGTYNYYFPGNSMGYAINSGRFAGENAADFALGD